MKPNGVIILHDCNPTSEAYCIPALSIQEAAEKAYKLGIGPFTGWCGDVWKAIVYLRSTRKDLDIHVLDCDWGLGIISKSTGVSEVLDISIDQISKMTYSDLDNQREFLLNLKEPSYFYQFLDQNL